MPGLDGWSVLQALKADPELAEIPVVMLTIVDEKNKGYALGASEYVTKPIDRERLRALLARFCEPPRSGLWSSRTTRTPAAGCTTPSSARAGR